MESFKHENDSVLLYRMRKNAAPTWRYAAKGILRAAKASVADVASRSGVTPAHVRNCLNGAKRPSHEVVLRINNAIAQATGYAAAEGFLSMVAALDGSTKPETWDPSQVAADVIGLLDSFKKLLYEGWQAQIETYIERDHKAGRRFILELLQALYRAHLSELLPPSEPSRAQVLALLKERVFDRDVLNENALEHLALGRLEGFLHRELFQANSKMTYLERQKAIARIFAAIEENDFWLRFDPPKTVLVIKPKPGMKPARPIAQRRGAK